VLLERQPLEIGKIGRVVPREVRVRLDHAGHERGAGPIDDRHAGGGQRAWTAAHAGDAIALDEDFP
jgi:hypothetical protein